MFVHAHSQELMVQAPQLIQLKAELTGAMGKRTKWQTEVQLHTLLTRKNTLRVSHRTKRSW